MAITWQDIPELLTRHEAAAFLGCSLVTVDRMMRDGELERVKIRHAVRIPRSSLVAALNNTSNLRRRGRRPGR